MIWLEQKSDSVTHLLKTLLIICRMNFKLFNITCKACQNLTQWASSTSSLLLLTQILHSHLREPLAVHNRGGGGGWGACEHTSHTSSFLIPLPLSLMPAFQIVTQVTNYSVFSKEKSEILVFMRKHFTHFYLKFPKCLNTDAFLQTF